MNRKNKDSDKLSVEDYVAVAFAEDLDLAQHYKQLLAESEIPAAVRRSPSPGGSAFSDIAVMVPEEYIEEAYAVIASESEHEDFFKMLFPEDQPDDDETLSEDIF